jgi:hypothetical protein
MSHYMSVDVGRDARLRVPCPSLHRVDRCTDIQQDRDRSVPQIVEADIRQACSLEDVFELPGNLGLVDVGPTLVVKIMPFSFQPSPAWILWDSCF